MASPLPQILVDRQFLTSEELAQWERRASAESCLLDDLLLREQVFTRDQLIQILENHFFCPSVDLRSVSTDPAILRTIPHRLAERHRAFPVAREGGKLRVAMADPANTKAIEAIAQIAAMQVVPLVALPSEIEQAIAVHYGKLASRTEVPERARVRTAAQPAEKPPAAPSAAHRIPAMMLAQKDIIPLVDTLVETAGIYGVSDIHLLPSEHDLTLSYRMDGILYVIERLPKEQGPAIISRIKILSGMDIAEHRLPQDGRFTRRLGKQLFDFRVSVLPSQFGEKIVIRLLSKSMALLDLKALQLPPAIWEGYRDTLDVPQGFFLVTGPTGCGKSTTLYATLNALDRESLNVISLEDPIEYTLTGMTQVQMKEEIGLNFATALRSVLRQDPDVVLVGEIRDLETVEIACRAALTGHKVFSTLHTNDAPQSITRLIDMGLQPYLIAATLKGVLAQRLVRVSCEKCRAPYTPTQLELSLMGYPKVETLLKGTGCAHCSGTGYKGRMGIFEYFRMDETMQTLVLERPSPFTLRQGAERNGMIPMAEFGRRAVLEGKTTVDEIARVILSDERHEQICPNCKHVVTTDYSVCPFCGHVLKQTCASCGAPIDPSWRSCPACGAAIERAWEHLYCRRCLAPLEPGATECRFCGEPVA